MSSAVILSSKASASFINSTFFQSKVCNIEIGGESRCKFENCDLSKSLDGISIYAHEGSSVDIDRSQLHDESKTAIFADSQSQLNIQKSKIMKCGSCGIFLNGDSKSVIQKNVIESNGTGIHAEFGEVRIDENTIKNNTEFGIYATNNVRFVSNDNNEFSENGKGDTQIS